MTAALRSRRCGHARPVGTLTAWYRFEWHADEPPQLGDVACQTDGPDGDPDELERTFLLVGIAETSSRRRPYRLQFERVEWGTIPEPGRRLWFFHNIPNGR